jgi:hypothetical protein
MKGHAQTETVSAMKSSVTRAKSADVTLMFVNANAINKTIKIS